MIEIPVSNISGCFSAQVGVGVKARQLCVYPGPDQQRQLLICVLSIYLFTYLCLLAASLSCSFLLHYMGLLF